MVDAEVKKTYQTTIGIECHVQLKTKTKLFSGASNDANDAAPNTTVSPICFGLPGVLPVLNKEAIVLAVRAGIALNAEVNHFSSFDRKHYFYPDLPKGYQTTQLEFPTVGKGKITITRDDGSEFEVRITRAHIEEDAGKLTHPTGADYSLVDLNRAGTPLIEVVSEADIHSPADAKFFAQELYRLMTFADVTYGDLYHGNMRFDVNVSVAKFDAAELGTRSEVKNLNSFKSVERAAEFEVNRQIELLEKGEKVVQETRGWHDAKQITFSQRSKENAHDYRYFPDADIPPVVIDDAYIDGIRQEMPLLPPAYRAAWKTLGLDYSVIHALLANQQLASLVGDIQKQAGDSIAKRSAHLLTSALVEQEDGTPADLPSINAAYLIELADMLEKGEVSSTAGKEIFAELLANGTAPRVIAEQKNLLQVSDSGFIEGIVDEVLADPASQQAVADIRGGNDKAIGFLVGQVMKKSAGKANPGLAGKLIRERL